MGVVSQSSILDTLSIIENREEGALLALDSLVVNVQDYVKSIRPMMELEAKVAELQALVISQAEEIELLRGEAEADLPNEQAEPMTV